ncbi:hypothetical protein PLEOSDRAFT_1106067 [Pleurotus ostreatus PC15]|uniref:Uncharacterized protein n=1 Tax=Pleurotus ostreatus (strain PC15) TaxID=1137138 RepID=A0A067NH40_PLEO1|nr:hypothetical protein PLEOSDRAFT_1106067 [Pleurotus ostreatus PC15]
MPNNEICVTKAHDTPPLFWLCSQQSSINTSLHQLGLPTLMTDKFKALDLLFTQVQLLKSFIKVVMKKPDSEKINFILKGEDCTAEHKVYSVWFWD